MDPLRILGGESTRRYAIFCLGIRELLLRWPGSVTSWWRTPTRNATLPESVKDSEHQLGEAADVVFDPGTAPPDGLFIAAARSVGIHAEHEADHWHLELLTTLV